MSIKITNEPVPRNKMRQFHEILCATGGVYIHNPIDCGDTFRVDYIPGDYALQQKIWRQCTMGIKEIDKTHWWCRFLRRIGIRGF